MRNLRKEYPVTVLKNSTILCENRVLNVKMRRIRQRDNLCVEYYQCSKSAFDKRTNQAIRCTFSGKVTYNKNSQPKTLELIREHLNHYPEHSTKKYSNASRRKRTRNRSEEKNNINIDDLIICHLNRPESQFDYELTSIDSDNDSEIIDINHYNV